MTDPDSFDEFLIDRLSRPAPPVGRYDRIQEAGMATRFVKGTSGNPNGRPKKQSNGPSIEDYCEDFR
jgi:hypothetical protein